MSRGKYAEITDRLPTWQQEEPTYQAKVDAKKREIYEEIGDALSSASIAILYKRIRQDKEAAEKILYDINIEMNAITQMLVDRYEIDEITSMKLETGDSVSIHYEPYAVVEDKEKIWEWCRANGYEREMQLSWNTLNAITKERLIQGQPEPDGVRAYTRVKPSYRKG